MLFRALKHQAGTPQRLVTFHDQKLAMSRAVTQLDTFLLRTDFERRKFANQKLHWQVPAEFEDEWKEYREKWAPACAHLEMRDVWPEAFGHYDPNERYKTKGKKLERPDPEVDSAFNPLYHDGGAAVEIGVDLIEFEQERREDLSNSDIRSEDDERVANMCRIARGAYDYLTKTIGIDPKEVFRRWRTVPAFFMPAQISNQHGDEKGSMNDLLDDAIRAYVCGAPAAAMAMCRATLEMVLKEHYLPHDHQYWDPGAKEWRDKPLAKLIVLASERYSFVQKTEVTRLKRQADRIMHNYARAKKMSPANERTILEFIETLKFLVQRAP